MDYTLIKSTMDLYPAYEALSNAAVAEAINLLQETKYKPLTSDWILEWSIARGVYQKMSIAIADPATPAELAATIKGVMLLVERDNTTLNLNKPEVVTLVNLFVTVGLFTQADLDSLYAAADDSGPVWRTFGRQLEAADIELARRLA